MAKLKLFVKNYGKIDRAELELDEEHLKLNGREAWLS